jgi:hypothetical protein
MDVSVRLVIQNLPWIDTIAESADYSTEHEHRKRVCGGLQDATGSRDQSPNSESLLPAKPISQQSSQDATDKIAKRKAANEDAFDARS